jgi:hypothetical protein
VTTTGRRKFVVEAWAHSFVACQALRVQLVVECLHVHAVGDGNIGRQRDRAGAAQFVEVFIALTYGPKTFTTAVPRARCPLKPSTVASL